jgi:hypothetical protein
LPKRFPHLLALTALVAESSRFLSESVCLRTGFAARVLEFYDNCLEADDWKLEGVR